MNELLTPRRRDNSACDPKIAHAIRSDGVVGFTSKEYSNAVPRATALLFQDGGGYCSAMLKGGSTPMARKVEWALSLSTLTVNTLVEATGVKGKSAISEWKRTGRVAKRHLLVLAQLTGTQIAWWLDDTAPIPPTGQWHRGKADADLPSPSSAKGLRHIKRPAEGRSAPTGGHAASLGVSKTSEERLPPRPPIKVENPQVIDGVELTRDAIEVAAAYMQLSGRQRQAIKMMIETLGMADSAIVADAQLERLRAPEKSKKEKV